MTPPRGVYQMSFAVAFTLTSNVFFLVSTVPPGGRMLLLHNDQWAIMGKYSRATVAIDDH